LKFLLARKQAGPRAEVKAVLAEVLPKRLADALVERHLRSGPFGEISVRDLTRLAEALNG
jgi:predicted flavoprotein YhiN